MEDTTKKTDDQRTAEEKLNDEMSKQNDLLTARIRYMKASGRIVCFYVTYCDLYVYIVNGYFSTVTTW